MVAPGATPSPGFDIVDRANEVVGQEVAESLAAGLASRIYAGRLCRGTATDAAAISVSASTLGNGGKAVLNYFAPSIAVVFLFIGSGLGMRSLLMERATGTLARLAASPVRPRSHRVGQAAGHRPHRAHLHPHRVGRDGRRRSAPTGATRSGCS